jgi:uncharacterized membrane protein YfbV (UPF0208 family)
MKIPPFGEWPTTQLTWLIQTILGVVGMATILVRFALTGQDAPVVLAGLIAALLAIERLAFIGKRRTSWSPTELAKAEQIKNGNGFFGNGE